MTVSLSVALGNYNHARFLPVSLKAICEQSLPPKELVVVDDASTDDSVAIIDGFARRYPFVRLLRNPKNMGAIASFNRAISETTGDFVICPASDDQLLPGFFEKAARVLSRHPTAGLCSALCRLIGENGEDLGPFHTPEISKEPVFVAPERFFELNHRHGNWILSQTTFYSRKGVQELGGFDPELGPAADALLVYVLAAKGGACFIPERLGSWRKMEGSFGLKTADDVERALKLADLLDGKLRATGLFPEDFLERSMRSTLMATLYEINRKKPYRFDDISALGTRLRRRSWTDLAFFAFMGVLKAAGHWASRLYLFLYQPKADRRRILAGKLRGLLR